MTEGQPESKKDVDKILDWDPAAHGGRPRPGSREDVEARGESFGFPGLPHPEVIHRKAKKARRIAGQEASQPTGDRE